MRKWFWVEFAARKLRKLCQPASTASGFEIYQMIEGDNVVDVSTEMKILMRYERIINTLESCVHSSCDIVLYHDILGGHYSDDNCILYCAT